MREEAHNGYRNRIACDADCNVGAKLPRNGSVVITKIKILIETETDRRRDDRADRHSDFNDHVSVGQRSKRCNIQASRKPADHDVSGDLGVDAWVIAKRPYD